MILPTGDDGAARSYVLDGVLDLSQITLNELLQLRRVTGLDLADVHHGLAGLELLIGLDDEQFMVALSSDPDLMDAYRAVIWIVRYRAGDRAPDGAVLTVDQASDFPFGALDVQPDPGDEFGRERDVSGPRTPPPAGRRGTGGAPARVTTRGRSSKASARKS